MLTDILTALSEDNLSQRSGKCRGGQENAIRCGEQEPIRIISLIESWYIY